MALAKLPGLTHCSHPKRSVPLTACIPCNTHTDTPSVLSPAATHALPRTCTCYAFGTHHQKLHTTKRSPSAKEANDVAPLSLAQPTARAAAPATRPARGCPRAQLAWLAFHASRAVSSTMRGPLSGLTTACRAMSPSATHSVTHTSA